MIKVSCGIISINDRVLVVRRSSTDRVNPFFWEFPGGKVDEGENFEDACIRELKEELSLDITPTDSLQPVSNSKIIIQPFICQWDRGMIELSFEHDDYMFVNQSELNELETTDLNQTIAKQYFDLYHNI